MTSEKKVEIEESKSNIIDAITELTKELCKVKEALKTQEAALDKYRKAGRF